MNSVGIPEGTEIKGDPCTCRWMTYTSMPAKTVLEKKCDWCKHKESSATAAIEPRSISGAFPIDELHELLKNQVSLLDSLKRSSL